MFCDCLVVYYGVIVVLEIVVYVDWGGVVGVCELLVCDGLVVVQEDQVVVVGKVVGVCGLVMLFEV